MTETNSWRTSSYSGNNNECVELAVRADVTSIRDTKARGAGTLVVGAAGFAAFRRAIKSAAPVND